MEQAPDGIFLCDARGRIVDANPAGCEMFLYSRNQLRRMCVTDLVLPEDAPRMATEMSSCARGGVARCEWRLLRHDHQVFVGEVACRALPGGRLQAIVRDITERRRMERDLRESEARFRAVFEQAASGIALVAPDGRWLRVNRALCVLLGHGEAQLLQMRRSRPSMGTSWRALRRQTGRLLAGAIDQYTRGDPPRRPGRRADTGGAWCFPWCGTPTAARSTLSCWPRTGAAPGAPSSPLQELRAGIQETAGTARGHRDRPGHRPRHQPALERRDRLCGSRGVRLLQSGKPEPERLLQVVNAGAEPGGTGRPGGAGTAPVPAKRRDAPGGRGSQRTGGQRHRSGGIQRLRRLRGREVDPDPGLRPVRANRLQIQKVLVNLLRNSVEAMREAGVATKIHPHPRAHRGRVRHGPRDRDRHRPGLDARMAKRIFEPFYTTKPRGIGMGLAICRSWCGPTAGACGWTPTPVPAPASTSRCR